MKRPALLIVITLAELGGAQSHVAHLMPYLAHSFDVHLAVGTDGPLANHARELGVKVHILSRLRREISLWTDWRAVHELRDLIWRIRPILVHAHSSKAGMVARLAAASLKTPCVFTAHGWGFKPGVPLARRTLVWAIEAFLAPLCEKLICVSEYDSALAARYLVGRVDQHVVVLNGIPDVAERATADADRKRIVMTARFQEPKDHDTLIKAFSALNDRDCELVLVGGGSGLERARALTEALGVKQRVQFLGDRTDVAAILSSASIFVLLSFYEGLPVSIIEAMRAGLPVVATGVGGIPEEVEHGVTGFLVPARSTADTVNALNVLLSDSALRASMGRAGRQKYEEKFTIEKMVASTYRIYETIVPNVTSKL